MLYSTSELIKYKVSGIDGELGKITDFYFDDREWSIRYAVVDTNTWLPGGKVLLSAHLFNGIDIENEHFNVELTKDQIKNSPDIDADEPVSRKNQELLHGYYNWPMYWGPTQFTSVSNGTPMGTFPIRIIQTTENAEAKNTESSRDEQSHLRSFKEIESYNIITSTGQMGKANDFVVEQDSWMVRYMVMGTAKLFASENVLVPIDWIKWISWEDRKVAIWATKEKLESCPPFEMEYPIDEKQESELQQYYDSAKE